MRRDANSGAGEPGRAGGWRGQSVPICREIRGTGSSNPRWTRSLRACGLMATRVRPVYGGPNSPGRGAARQSCRGFAPALAAIGPGRFDRFEAFGVEPAAGGSPEATRANFIPTQSKPRRFDMACTSGIVSNPVVYSSEPRNPRVADQEIDHPDPTLLYKAGRLHRVAPGALVDVDVALLEIPMESQWVCPQWVKGLSPKSRTPMGLSPNRKMTAHFEIEGQGDRGRPPSTELAGCCQS